VTEPLTLYPLSDWQGLGQPMKNPILRPQVRSIARPKVEVCQRARDSKDVRVDHVPVRPPLRHQPEFRRQATKEVFGDHAVRRYDFVLAELLLREVMASWHLMWRHKGHDS
jgi:hypothetical protein